MLIWKIKQAETALADGRLDEAYELLQTPAIREHCRAQDLVGRLSQALLTRGRRHWEAGHLPQALGDCNKAERMGGLDPEVLDLRQAVCDAMDQRYHAGQAKQQRLAQIQRQLDQGRLSIGEQLLREASTSNGEAARLNQEVHMQRLEIEQLQRDIEQALIEDNVDQALSIVIGAWETIQTGNGRCSGFLKDIKQRALAQIQQDLQAGHVRRAQALLARLSPLAQAGDPIEECDLALNLCAEAGQQLENGQIEPAVHCLQKAQTLLPEVGWLKQALKQARAAAVELETLRTGPLLLLGASQSPTAPKQVPPQEKRPMQKKSVSAKSSNLSGTTAWLLQIDGVGSYLVYTESTLTVGPISSSVRPILGLLVDPTLPTVTIQRSEEDYFLMSPTCVRVDRQETQRMLLSDGQKIALSDRCRLKFNRPNAASTTATLSFAGGRVPRRDVRYAIMMDDCLLIGPQTHHHICATAASEVVTLVQRDGQLCCQSNKTIKAAGQVLASNAPLPLNQTIHVGELSLVLTQA